ncbi:MAG: methylenetetrahydrofolate--tRNA-(uracil(54)-C(5))-methyltransferase (FADH(2)-oxidizing) TrmFO [Clostridia bacterium]
MGNKVIVIGGGLAGCEASYQLAKRGYEVDLYEMKPEKMSSAHHAKTLAEIVCSNSFKSKLLTTSSGMLKAELELLGSIILNVANECSVPAGSALAVDRDEFTIKMDEIIHSMPNINVICSEIAEIPLDSDVIIATGPLTSDALANNLEQLLGEKSLSFFDASAPIVSEESLDDDFYFTLDRYGKGESDYINCPLTKDEYDNFVKELTTAKRIELHEFENTDVFDGCMPIEIMASRGLESLRYGPMRPVGLIDPKTGKRPYAVVQLRKENTKGELYNIVGFQTNLTFGEQKRVFSLIPALKNAEFLKYGVMHRNTFICAPKFLCEDFSLKNHRNIFIAGQLSGVEGYMESTMSGLISALGMIAFKKHLQFKPFGDKTMIGALCKYLVSASEKDFQPMNSNFGLLNPLDELVKDKIKRKEAYSLRGINELKNYLLTEGKKWL